MYKLVDMFWTFQGEGLNAGTRALFIRLPFCNLKCSWCDTEFNTFKDFSKEDFTSIALSEKSKFAVITGGEPMMNKQTAHVIEHLKDLGFLIACETNGCFPIVPGIDFVTVSPKRDAKYQIHPNAVVNCHELKLVVDKDFKFEVAKEFERVFDTENVRLSLSPEYGNMKESFSEIENFIRRNPRWHVSLQTHKWLGIK